MRSPRTLIVYPHGDLASNPTIVALIRELIRRGVLLEIMTPAPPLELGVAAAIAPSWIALPPLTATRPSGARSAWRAFIEAVDVRRIARYAGVIGVDPLGIAIAARLNATARRPMAYVSFELMFEAEVEGGYETDLKAQERAAARASDLVVVQDPERRDALCRENGVDADRCILIPVSPEDARPGRTDYLRKRFGLAADDVLVLYQGSLYDWSCRDELAELVSYWPTNWRLVIHCRADQGRRMRRFLEEIASLPNVTVSTEPVSPEELPALTASADIGLACYRATPSSWLTGDNLRLLGLASGKVAYYAMCGLPVLARSFGTLDRLVLDAGMGATYARLSEAPAALSKILASQEQMSAAARSFYETHLDPNPGLTAFCDRWMEIAGIRAPC